MHCQGIKDTAIGSFVSWLLIRVSETRSSLVAHCSSLTFSLSLRRTSAALLLLEEEVAEGGERDERGGVKHQLDQLEPSMAPDRGVDCAAGLRHDEQGRHCGDGNLYAFSSCGRGEIWFSVTPDLRQCSARRWRRKSCRPAPLSTLPHAGGEEVLRSSA